MSIIHAEKLTKSYGKSRGIIDVDLAVGEGEIFGFIGPNGAGKSTTIRTLIGLLFPTSGRAEIFGFDIVRQGHVIRERVGFVPSEGKFYASMKVSELLEYSRRFYKNGRPDRTAELLELMDLDPSRKIDELSSGNQKKAAIVQSLLSWPDLLILDEPTNGLDPLIQTRFFNYLQQENKRGVTIFLSSHILSEVQKFCKRVAVIKEGRIIETEEIEILRKRQLKKIEITAKTELPESFFAGETISELKRTNGTYRFLYSGDINLLIRKVAAVDIVSVLIQEPSLEEVFMHYYESEKEAAE